jgi:pullulanase
MRRSIQTSLVMLCMMCSFTLSAQTNPLTKNFTRRQAYWIDQSTIAIQQTFAQSGGAYELISDGGAQLALGTNGVTGGIHVPLTAGATLSAAQLARFPQLATGYMALALPSHVEPAIYLGLLQGQLAVSVVSGAGVLTYATGVQDAGVLDQLYAYSGKLGVIFRHSVTDAEWAEFPRQPAGEIRIKVWAPTAQQMNLHLFNKSTDTAPTEALSMSEHNGVWVATIPKKWTGKYYLLDETVYVPSSRTIVEHQVTDPYSIDLSLNGAMSRLSDLDDDSTKPAGWDENRSPALDRINDLSIYELHVRDFSIGDATVPAEKRGTYTAFAHANSDGMKHLRALASAGLKAVHIMPSFHIGSISEDKTTWAPTPDLTVYAPDGQQQQTAVTAVAGKDAYNWGYDPVHYLAPEGAYAVDPDDRVRQYRRMVMSLHDTGLRVIQDVVFNHLSATGETANSVLDKVVPGYYIRLDANGNNLTASCCADTATEHVMMGKLQQDAILWNVQNYKIDGFRFDLMSFTFISNLKAIQQALSALTLAKDGIDGPKIYIYGEGWSFGETANSALGVNAQQLNLYGTGFGSFNDRIRDGIRGTGTEQSQGYANGLFTDSSTYTIQNLSPSVQKTNLTHISDWIRIGLTGNLRDYSFTDSTGATITGSKLDYNGSPAGYTATPVEDINYASVHDDQILFDQIQIKSSASDTSATRARRQVLASSLVELGQGIPFFAGGDDLLRSKDMDTNSYNSGDWFNKIDWTGRGNNWGIGLPVASQNSAQWTFMQPLLANGALKPTSEDILSTADAFQEFLQIRNSSPLFRLATAPQIQQQLTFLNTGAAQVPGLIVMELKTPAGAPASHILVIFNGTMTEQDFTSPALVGLSLKLHPIQRKSADPIVRTSTFNAKKGLATVPALTTAVFVDQD